MVKQTTNKTNSSKATKTSSNNRTPKIEMVVCNGLGTILSTATNYDNDFELISNPDMEAFKEAILSDYENIKYFTDLTEEHLKEAIKIEPAVIKRIPDLSIPMQIFAIDEWTLSLFHMTNPCKEAQLRALKIDGYDSYTAKEIISQPWADTTALSTIYQHADNKMKNLIKKHPNWIPITTQIITHILN